jgi:protein-S-isoprenylcysteine O-methyltransferase Ste14
MDSVMKLDVAVPIASVLLIYLARLVELKAKRDTIAGPVRENLTFRLFMMAGTLMLISSIAEFLLRRSALFWPTFIAGWLCAAASFGIRRRAIAALGKFWSLHVEIRADHKFVRSGPFRWVRHPTYFSMILELVCVGLILNAYISICLAAAVFVPALFMRLKLEETALVEKFGPTYRTYQNETPAIFPYKWPAAK